MCHLVEMNSEELALIELTHAKVAKEYRGLMWHQVNDLCVALRSAMNRETEYREVLGLIADFSYRQEGWVEINTLAQDALREQAIPSPLPPEDQL